MDEGLQGMLIFGVVLAACVAFVVFKRFRSRGGRGDVRPTDVDPRAIALRAALEQGQPAALASFLQSLGPDWDARSYYLRQLTPFCSRASLDALCAQQPSPLHFLVRGCHGIDWAWEARGRGGASTVSASAAQTFHQRLTLAEQDLNAAAQGDPADPTPHAYLIKTAMALGAPREVAHHHFAAATARQPDHFLAHDNMLSFLSRRWSGSDAEMFDFVRGRVASAPHGSDLPMLLVEAHLDVWSYIHTFERSAGGAMQYLNRPDVRAEINDAYMRTLGGPARSRASTVHHRNSAAFAFYLLQDVQRARVEHERIAGAYTEYPWVYMRNDDQETRDVITYARLWAGLR